MICVDEKLFFSPEENIPANILKYISDAELELKVEDSVAGFVGICINQNHRNGSIKLTQTGRAKQIIKASDIGYPLQTFTTTTIAPLIKGEDVDPPNGPTTISVLLGCFNIYRVIHALISPIM